MVLRNNASVQTAFIDLATFSELEAFLYGGCEACTYFVRGIKKSNWFSFLPACLRHVSGTPDFNRQFAASVNRAGDYVLSLWLRVRFPLLYIPERVWNPNFPNAPPAGLVAPSLRWTRKLMHNLVSRVNISFNELMVQELDSHWLDFNSEFRLPESKRVGYNNMIGDVLQMTSWTTMVAGDTAALGTGGYFDLILPFWFTEDSGVALPAAALPFNEIKINYELRGWESLLVLDPGLAAGGAAAAARTKNEVIMCTRNNNVGPGLTAGGIPSLGNDVETWAQYAIVHNDERVKIGKAPRDILIQQVQHANGYDGVAFTTSLGGQTSSDVRFSHSIIALFWAAANNSIEGARSNYTTAPYFSNSHSGGGFDPISHTALVYESTNRVDMDSDFYSLVEPYICSTRVPDETGYHYLSYSLHTWQYDPLGSTNYSKLNNVSLSSDASRASTQAALGFGQNDALGGGGDLTVPIIPTPSTAIPVGSNNYASGGTFPANGDGQVQTFQYIIRALNWNISRISGGSLGLPVL